MNRTDVLEPIYYYFSFKDTTGNKNDSAISKIDIIDNDKPQMVSDLSDSNAYANESYDFLILVSDNLETVSVDVEYYFGNSGQLKTKTLIKDLNYFNASIKIPNSMEKLNYRFILDDSNPLNRNKRQHQVCFLDLILIAAAGSVFRAE